MGLRTTAPHIVAAALATLVVGSSTHDASAQATDAAGGVSRSTLASPDAEMALVHVDSPEEVSLELERGQGQWWAVCSSPCDVALPLSETYRIVGRRVLASDPFHIRPGQSVVLRVDSASATARTVSVILSVVGLVSVLPVVGVASVAALLGVFICPFGANGGSVSSCIGNGVSSDLSSLPRGLWFTALGGAVLLATGVTWRILGKKKTTVTQAFAPLTLPAPAGSVPAWDAPVARMAAVRTVTFPILDVRF